MRAIPMSVISAVTRELKPYENAAALSVENALLNALTELGKKRSDDLTDDELKILRNVAAEAAHEAAMAFGQNVTVLSSDFVSAITGKKVNDRKILEWDEYVPSRSDISKKMHAAIGDVMEGDETVSGFIRKASEYGGKIVSKTHHRALDSMTSGSLRWARVPSGSYTCKFCTMLASRGPVYHDAEKAGEHYHLNCDCRVVCGPYSEKSRKATINVERYDPGEYLSVWRDSISETARANAAKNGTTERTERILALAADAKAADGAEFADQLIEDAFSGIRTRTERQKFDAFGGMLEFCIPSQKVDKYMLKQKDKAKAFDLALGYGYENSDDLILQIFEKARTSEMQSAGDFGFGETFYQNCIFDGPNGKKAKVTISWIKRYGEDRMQLTSCYIDKR